MRYLKWCIVSLFIYNLLTIMAWLIDDLGWKKGVTEGSYQIYANLISNIQFLIKIILGMDDVINYNFRVLPFIIGAIVWIFIAILFCKLKNRTHH
ncbi:hypothetical protein [Paenibacillus sedimenti]|uniref:Uncharacterized protein n=1 Tax=Paenibacillus sedimenti TaxID=2770274 RepID=A0A926KTF5_9BACL|nr:hypothetical protein [Paenibacillus sedimenti]MBD0382831.1 hypothetical protein [Paenibacillus sedimenti]